MLVIAEPLTGNGEPPSTSMQRMGLPHASSSSHLLICELPDSFVAPRSADDSIGEVALVGAASLALGLALGGLPGEVGAGVGVVTSLGDRRDLGHGVHPSVPAEVWS